MKFSIITVVYNDVNNIRNTILSVLNQSYTDFEYIIVDGASTDGTIDIINSFRTIDSRICVYSELDSGIYHAMNKGIALSCGDYLNFMNSGDFFKSCEVLHNVSNMLEEVTCVDVLYGSAQVLNGNSVRIVKSSPINQISYKLPFCHQSVFVRRSVLKTFPFSLKYKYASDYDQFVSISKNPIIVWKQVFDVFSIVTVGGAADFHRITTAKEYLDIAKHHFGSHNCAHRLLYVKVILSVLYKKLKLRMISTIAAQSRVDA
jgi:glycosyltransferase involved in cell wall biosynthesis